MLPLCWILVLLPAGTRSHSGDGDAEPTVSCTSDIMTGVNSLTCKLVGGGNEDDEDEEADAIEKMTACYVDLSTTAVRTKCVTGSGNTIDSRDLSLVIDLNVTVHFKGGGQITTMIDLKKIVKPRRPQVWNVTWNHESNQVLIRVRTPYHREYLKVENQLFQLSIWNSDGSTIQNVTSLEHVVMRINMERLQTNTEYRVKVRTLPLKHLQGTWSEWSDTFSFCTPAEEKVQEQVDDGWEVLTLTMCLVSLVVVVSGVVLLWKNKIFSCMWPSIPHPKHTLVQICKPNKGLLLNFKPEVFSALKVYPLERTEEQPCDNTEPSSGGTTQSSEGCMSTTSISTEELELDLELDLELHTLLSRGSSDGEDLCPSPLNILQRPPTPQAEHSSGGHEAGGSQQEEAYVTMSSLYQMK